MATNNVIGKLPEFTTDDSAPNTMPVIGGEEAEEQVKQAPTEEVVEAGKDQIPSVPAADQTPPVTETPGPDSSKKAAELERAVEGLKAERENLLREVVELKGKRREIKQEKLVEVQKQIDQLEDVNPEDVNLIHKVLRAKGYITKEEAGKMFYESVKQEQLSKFLEKYPEYRPENDPTDARWNALHHELEYFRQPDDPYKVLDMLEKAHKSIAIPTSTTDRQVATRKRQIEVASVGSGGTQRSSSIKQLDPYKRAMLEQGGFTKEDILKIEQQL